MAVVTYTRRDAPEDLRPLEVFCNSARFLYGDEALAEPEDAAGWLRDHDLLPSGTALTSDDIGQLVRFREALRDHLDGREPAKSAADLNSYAETTLSGAGWASDATPTLFPTTERGADGLIARLLTVLYRADVTGHTARLKPCRATDCRWIFYDRSPGGNSVWCSMEICGARHKMRTYRARRHNTG